MKVEIMGYTTDPKINCSRCRTSRPNTGQAKPEYALCCTRFGADSGTHHNWVCLSFLPRPAVPPQKLTGRRLLEI